MSLAFPLNIATRINRIELLRALLGTLPGPVTYHVFDGRFTPHSIAQPEFCDAAARVAGCSNAAFRTIGWPPPGQCPCSLGRLMSIFAPVPENMVGIVPTSCPRCNRMVERDDLTLEQKQFLIDATGYHENLTEYTHMQTLDLLLRRYPGTRNPLVTSKLRKRLYGNDDEVAVKHLIDSIEGFRDFLERCEFDHFGRFSFISGLLRRSQENVAPMLVTCPHCPNQYAILPFSYHISIG